MSLVDERPASADVGSKRAAPSDVSATSTKRSKAGSEASAVVELQAGLVMLAERKGDWELAELLRPSTKQEGAWAVKFESDGKVFTRTNEQLKPAEEEEEEEEEGDSDEELEFEDDE